MQELWSSASYEPRLLSLPFAVAPAAMVIVLIYTATMRGAPVLRGFLMLHFVALLPYATVVAMSPSITSPTVAEHLFRAAAATIPLAAAAGTGFQLSLVRRYRAHRGVVLAMIGSSFAWIVVATTSNIAIDGVVRIGDLWFPHAGPAAWVALLHTFLVSLPGFVGLALRAFSSKPSDERRQFRAALIANAITSMGLLDVALAYGIGAFPVGWLLSGIGSLLVVRAILVEDLLRVRAVDVAAPMLAVHATAAVFLAWVVLAQLPPRSPWWAVTIVIAFVFAGVRAAVATFGLITRGARSSDGPLERLLAQLVTRARSLATSGEIARLAIDIVELGVGARAEILLAAEEDWGWTTVAGVRVADEVAPDPLLAGWLVEYRGPQGGAALFAADLEAVPPDLRDLMTPLFEGHHARALIPVRSGEDLLALVIVPEAGRRVRGPAIAFVERVADRLAEALAHARMARRASDRAALAREVQLAATVQAGLLPGKGPHVLGDLTVVGSWQPATRCAGDFWGLYPLGDGRVLVAIADVTGHGVASAMVTAGAAGAFDVCVRRSGAALELPDLMAALDAAVRRVGGGTLAMTCFAGIVDPVAKKITYVSCAHPTPYLCRLKDDQLELQALIGRGNLLGMGTHTTPRQQERALEPGDVLVWYTDGVIEALDPAGKAFGDRRLQLLLKRLDKRRLAPLAVHDIVQASVAAHRAGRPLDDDETVVVARLAAPTRISAPEGVAP